MYDIMSVVLWSISERTKCEKRFTSAAPVSAATRLPLAPLAALPSAAPSGGDGEALRCLLICWSPWSHSWLVGIQQLLLNCAYHPLSWSAYEPAPVLTLR